MTNSVPQKGWHPIPSHVTPWISVAGSVNSQSLTRWLSDAPYYFRHFGSLLTTALDWCLPLEQRALVALTSWRSLQSLIHTVNPKYLLCANIGLDMRDITWDKITQVPALGPLSLTGEETRNQDSVPHSHTVYCNHIAWKTLGSIPESNFRRDLVGERSLSAW